MPPGPDIEDPAVVVRRLHEAGDRRSRWESSERSRMRCSGRAHDVRRRSFNRIAGPGACHSALLGRAVCWVPIVAALGVGRRVHWL